MIQIERLLKLAKLINAKGLVMREYNNPRRNNNAFNKSKFNKKLTVEEFFVEGKKTITAMPEKSNGKHVIFLHGGAYVSEGLSFHRRFMEKLCLDYGYTVSYIDYPLAPEHTADYTHKIVLESYKKITKKYNGDFILLGDSAGGGLALSFRQTLLNKKCVQPIKTVLISPWLDVSMSNPKATEYEKIDPTLSVEGLKYTGKKFAGKLSVKDPLVSPIFGITENLGEIFMTTGTHETFYPDVIDFSKVLSNKQGTTCTLKVYDGLFHDFVMMPIKESKTAIKDIHDFIMR